MIDDPVPDRILDRAESALSDSDGPDPQWRRDYLSQRIWRENEIRCGLSEIEAPEAATPWRDDPGSRRARWSILEWIWTCC